MTLYTEVISIVTDFLWMSNFAENKYMLQVIPQKLKASMKMLSTNSFQIYLEPKWRVKYENLVSSMSL